LKKGRKPPGFIPGKRKNFENSREFDWAHFGQGFPLQFPEISGKT